MMSEQDEFAEFAAALGRVMVKGLNKLPAATQKMISEATEDGAYVFAICLPEPVCLVGMLSHDDMNIELFRATEGVMWN